MPTRRIKAIIDAENRTGPAFKGVTTGLQLIGVAAAAVGAVALGRTLVRGMAAATKAAAVQEDAEVKLAQALRLSGQAVGETLPKLQAHASALQDITGVGDEVILANQSLLVSMGKLSGEGLKRATQAALDMGAQTGNLAGAFDLVAKASVGYTSTLSRYGIILDESIPQSEKFVAALAKIEELFGGQAQAQLETYSGRLRELEGRFGDLQEVVGQQLGEVLKEFMGSVLSPFIKELTTAAEGNDTMRIAVIDAAIAFAEMGAVLEPTINKLVRWATLATIIGTLKLKAGIDLQTQALKALGFAADETGGKFAELIARLEAMKHKTTGGFGGPGFEPATDASDPVSVIRAVQAETLEAIEMTTQGVLESYEFIMPQSQALAESIELTGAAMLDLGHRTKHAIGDIAYNAAFQFGDALVDAAFGADVAFKEFFRNLLKDIAKAIVQALILKAILGISGVGFQRGGLTNNPGNVPLAPLHGPGFRRGGITQAQTGIIAGRQIGRDSQAIVTQPGEAVLPRDLTEMLLASAGGGGGPQTVYVEIGPNLSKLTDEINVRVRRGEARLTATDLAGSRTRR